MPSRQLPVPVRYLLAAVIGAALAYGLLLLTMGTRDVDPPRCFEGLDGDMACLSPELIPRALWVDLTAAALGAAICVWALAFHHYVNRRWEATHGKIDASTSVGPT